jgi:hypothetical protein
VSSGQDEVVGRAADLTEEQLSAAGAVLVRGKYCVADGAVDVAFVAATAVSFRAAAGVYANEGADLLVRCVDLLPEAALDDQVESCVDDDDGDEGDVEKSGSGKDLV